MEKTIKPNFVTLKFIEETFYKGEIRKIGEQFEVDGSYAKNFLAQRRAFLVQSDSDNDLELKLEDLKKKLPELSVGQIAKERKDVLVALAFSLGISTVPDDLKNKEIAQLIYDNVHGRPE